MGATDTLDGCSGEGFVCIGVIRGNGKPELRAPPAEDDEVLLPQLELRLPPTVHCPSSSPRTVNSLVNNSAFVG